MARARVGSASRNVVARYDGSWAERVMPSFLDQLTRVCSIVRDA
jgi:hypothetical protein